MRNPTMTDFKTEPQNTKKKWFDKLTTLSPVEGQIPMTKIKIPNNWFLILFEIWILRFEIYLSFGACNLLFPVYSDWKLT
jgi:hypothetical protein